MAHSFNDLTPPPDLVSECEDMSYMQALTCVYRAGAEQAAERFKGQWPEPITDRLPTKEDADEAGYVQFHTPNGRWDYGNWESAARGDYPWLHTPRWQPPAPPTLKEQALASLAEIRGKYPGYECSHLDVIQSALEAQP